MEIQEHQRMWFEFLIRQILGSNQGYSLSGAYHNPKVFKKYILRVIRKLEKRVDEIEMDERLREMIFLHFANLTKEVKHIIKYKNKKISDLIVCARHDLLGAYDIIITKTGKRIAKQRIKYIKDFFNKLKNKF